MLEDWVVAMGEGWRPQEHLRSTQSRTLSRSGLQGWGGRAETETSFAWVRIGDQVPGDGTKIEQEKARGPRAWEGETGLGPEVKVQGSGSRLRGSSQKNGAAGRMAEAPTEVLRPTRAKCCGDTIYHLQGTGMAMGVDRDHEHRP